jgi:hypothetical protein
MDLRHLVAGLVILAVPIGAASCSDSAVANILATSDGGKGSDSGDTPLDDAGNPIEDDSGTSGKDSGGNPDGGPIVGATQLATGSIGILGITEDDYVLYYSTVGTTDSLNIVSLAGGAPVVLAPALGADDVVAIDGKTVAFWIGTDKTTGIGTMSLWTKAGGIKAVGAGSRAGIFAATADGARIAYSMNAVATGTEVMIGNPALNPASTSILTVAQAGTGCDVTLKFVGARLFSSTCAGAATTATIRTFTAANVIQSVETVASPGFMATDTAGTHVFVKKNAAAGNATVKTIPATGAVTSVTMDTAVASGVILPDGANVIYRTSAQALKRSPTAAGAPVTLIPTGVRAVLDYSPDFGFAMVFSNAPDTANTNVTRIDVQLASTAAAGTLTPLVATSIGAPVGFTSNGANVVYLTDLPATGAPLGTLKARGTAAGSTEKEIAKLVAAPEMIPGGSKVVFADNPQPVGQGVGVDIKVADVAGAGTPTVVAPQVELGFYVTKTMLVYTTPTALFTKALP